MSDTTPRFDTAPLPPAAPPPERSWFRAILAEGPYLLMLLAGFVGVAIGGGASPNLLYWQILAPVFCLLCIAAGWNAAAGRGMRVRLIWTQLAHWAAILAAMLMLFLPSIRGVVNDNGTEINLLLLLGLGTLIAGIHAGSWRIIAVGAVLGGSVPTMAVLQESAVLLAVGAILIAMIGTAFVVLRGRG